MGGWEDEVVLRPGLVYSDPPRSVFAMFDKLSRLPVIPALGTRPCIQMVDVREVAECIDPIDAAPRVPKLLMIGAMRSRLTSPTCCTLGRDYARQQK